MKTILVVDDERAVAVMLQVTLQDEGYRVITAGDGREALDVLAKVHPDLVVSDVMMPGMDGRDLCRMIQEHPDHQSIPVVLMSALGRAALDDGGCDAAAFIPKPFEIDDFVDTVAKIIGPPEGRGTSGG